ncbi:MAG: hypothetical protein AAGI53_05240 [Planctomycetota bacterium]
MAVGFIVGVATLWPGRLSDQQAGLAFGAMLAPTVFTSLVGAPRPIKDTARFLLGVLTASAFVFLFVADSWLARGIVVGVYVVARGVLSAKRKRHHKSEIDRYQAAQAPAAGAAQ